MLNLEVLSDNYFEYLPKNLLQAIVQQVVLLKMSSTQEHYFVFAKAIICFRISWNIM